MSLLNKSGFSPGTSFSVDEAGDIANMRLELDGLKVDDTENRGVSGITGPSPAATFWVAYRAVKNDVIVTLRHAVDPNTTELHIVLEQYVDNGGSITAVDTKRDTIKITPDMLSVVAGVTVLEREFSKKLEQNSLYGLLRYAATLAGSKRDIYAPAADPPARGSRAVGDYITTFNSTNGQAIARQDASQFNLIYNGSIEYATAAGGTTLDNWDRRDSGWAALNITTTNTDPVFWDKANNRLAWQDKDHGPTIGLGQRLHRSEFISPSLDIWASSAFSFDVSIDANLQSAAGTSEVVTVFHMTLDLTTGVQRLNALLETLAAYDTTVKHRLKFSTTTPLNNDGGGGTGRIVYISYVMVPRGKFPAVFSYRVEAFELGGGKVVTDVGATEDADATVTRVVPSTDIGPGIFEQGRGGLYLPQ